MSPEAEPRLRPPEQRLGESGVVNARDIVDRLEIEQHANYLIANREAPEFMAMDDEHVNNAATGLFEQLSAAGHLSHIEFEGDQHQVHVATLKRLLNGYSDDKPIWEQERNFMEICEELTVYSVFLEVQAGNLPEDTILITNSDYPDNAGDKEAKDNGYRSLNRKGMVRTYHFEQSEDGAWTRVLEQVSRSNSHDMSTREWFNANTTAVPISTTGALGEQAVTTRDRLPDGVVTLVEELDNTYGTDRLYGESENEQAENEHSRPDYANLREVSASNEAMLSHYVTELADIDRSHQLLQNQGVLSYDERLYRFDQAVKDIIRRIRLMTSKFDKDTLEDKIAIHAAQQARIAFSRGDHNATQHHLMIVEQHKNQDAEISCGGAGSSDEESDPYELFDKITSTIQDAEDDKSKWKWTQGVCEVKSCATRPGKTEVGPCSVCRGCQAKFDEGIDPTEEKPSLFVASGEMESAAESIVSGFEDLLKSVGSVAVDQSGVDADELQPV